MKKILEMSYKASFFSIAVFLLSSCGYIEYPNPERFERAMLAFDEKDALNPPPEGAIVFTGSSSIRRWQSQAGDTLAPLTIIHRGFGGSNMHDALYYLERVALRYKPRAILIYEGDNDTGSDNTIPSGLILSDLQTIISTIHLELPETRIYVLSIKPSIMREAAWPIAQEVNAGYQEIANEDPLVYYVDVATPLLQPDGTVRTDIFLKNGLHLNPEGNEIFGRAIKEVLLPIEAQFE